MLAYTLHGAESPIVPTKPFYGLAVVPIKAYSTVQFYGLAYVLEEGEGRLMGKKEEL